MAVARPENYASARRASAVAFEVTKTLVQCGVEQTDVNGVDSAIEEIAERTYVHVIGVAGMKIRSQILGGLLKSQCLERLSGVLNLHVTAHRFGVNELEDHNAVHAT